MAKKLTLEERAAKKFPCPSDASDKERSSILAMQKAWIRVEQVRQEEQEKKKRQADRDALKLGKELQQRYPGITLENIALALETEQKFKEIAQLATLEENEKMGWIDSKKASRLVLMLSKRYRKDLGK